jgi:hypothetical protein
MKACGIPTDLIYTRSRRMADVRAVCMHLGGGVPDRLVRGRRSMCGCVVVELELTDVTMRACLNYCLILALRVWGGLCQMERCELLTLSFEDAWPLIKEIPALWTKLESISRMRAGENFVHLAKLVHACTHARCPRACK